VPDAPARRAHGDVQPGKRVPANGRIHRLIAPARSGAQALVDVARYKNADALVHVVRAFRDASVRIRRAR
jgi:hypothetical protein